MIRSCVICRRFTTKSPNVPSSSLPENRVKDAKAFQIIGIDLAGPLFMKDKSKTWVVLFTCAIYRAVHLELVDSLSTDAFILALQRHICRRGRPATIYTDNGTNFVGADNLFKKLDWKRIQEETSVMKIEWRFNPPSGAWWGGWWERLIRTIKDLLKRMLGHGRLNHVQMETCLCEVEAVINGRPLTYVTEDQQDLIPLTPSMFLQDVRSVEFPEMESLDGDGLRQKYRGLTTLREELRSRFRKEYLSQLIQRGKVLKPEVFHVGDLVLVGSDNKKRLEWPMARVDKLLPGKDGKVRVARLKTQNGFYVRPLQRLYPLEVSSVTDPLPITDSVKKLAQKFSAEKTSREVEDEKTCTKTRYGRKVVAPVRLGQ